MSDQTKFCFGFSLLHLVGQILLKKKKGKKNLKCVFWTLLDKYSYVSLLAA